MAENKLLDCVIVGGGPAGISAAVYLVRKKMDILLVSPDIGGQAAKSSEIENYLGFTKISGPELTGKFFEQMEALKVNNKIGDEVKSIEKTEKGFVVKTGNESFEAKSVLITSGKMPRKLGVPGEDKFAGHGVGYCAICDGPLFHDKPVAVIGGGNSALDAALELEKYASKVYILNLNIDFQGDEIRKDKVKNSKKIETFLEVETTEFFGKDFLEGIKYKTKTGEVKEISCNGAFIEVGWTPATSFLKDMVKLNNLSEIEIDLENRTNIPGLFAAGDVTNISEKQIVIAAGEGAKAALNLWRYIILEHAKK